VPPPEPVQPSSAGADAAPGAAEVELSVDLAAFLPDDVVVGDDAVADDAAPDDAEPSDAAPADAPGVDLEALDQVEADLTAVDAAIAALDAGTYGIDAATGAPIPDAELAADPTRCS
jgi:hypothetical protein